MINPKEINILVGCEESQAVCREFRKLGFNAYSCDTQPCSGGHPEWHIQGDVLEQLDKGWDMMIGFPTCTFITNSGVRWLYNTDGTKNEQRWSDMKKGVEFFNKLWGAGIPRIAIENPIPHKHAAKLMAAKYDQLIQPWMFGHGETKATCLWLKNLPPLFHNSKPDLFVDSASHVDGREGRIHKMAPGPDRGKLRSKTFPGIAKAMAVQWSKELR